MNYRISGVKYCCVEIRQVLQKAVTFRKFRSCEIPNKMRLDSRKRKCGVDHSIWWRELIRVFWIFYIKCVLSKDEKICIQIYIYIFVLYSCLLHGTGRAVGPWKHQLNRTKASIQSRHQKWKGITSKMTVWWRPNWAQPRSRKEPVRSAMIKAI